MGFGRNRMGRSVNLRPGRTRRSAPTNPRGQPARLPAGTGIEDRQEWRSLRRLTLRKLCPFLALASFALQPLQSAPFDHALWDRLLKTYVSESGEVDYAALKADRADLDEYVRRLGESSPTNRPEQFPDTAAELAYWLNAYNALVIRGVVDNYPTRSVTRLGYLYGFFRRKDYIAGGTRLSLKHIEDKIIRQQYRDPRIHFGLVCASISCPLLPREAFTNGLFRVLSGRRSQIEFPTVEVDGVDEVLLIAETARRGLDPLNP